MKKHYVKTMVLGMAISMMSASLAFADTPATEAETETSYETTETQAETTEAVTTAADVVVGGLKDDGVDDLASILGSFGTVPETEAELSEDTEEFNGTVEAEPETEPETTVPETEPETTVPETEPETEPETTVPETESETTVPETTIPETEMETTVPETEPETTVPETEPETESSREYHEEDEDIVPETVELLVISNGQMEVISDPEIISEELQKTIPDTLPKAGEFDGITSMVGTLCAVLAAVTGFVALIRRRYFS